VPSANRKGEAWLGDVRVRLFPPVDQLTDGPVVHRILARAADEGVDHICVGDHMSFLAGAGPDGLISATSILAAQRELPEYVGLYLRPLSPPVAPDEQLGSRRPGRLAAVLWRESNGNVVTDVDAEVASPRGINDDAVTPPERFNV